MYNITVLKYDGKSVRFDNITDRVWVSLTDMATATDTRVNNWSKLTSTKQFLKDFEEMECRPVMEMVQGDVSAELRGLWAIDEVAIEFAAWCTRSFRVWVSQGIRNVIEDEPDPVANIPITKLEIPESPKQKMFLTPAKLDLLRSALSSVPAPLRDEFLLSQVQVYHPELKPVVDAANLLLAATTHPTAIGLFNFDNLSQPSDDLTATIADFDSEIDEFHAAILRTIAK